jgi:AcrR family transcriptional regulator
MTAPRSARARDGILAASRALVFESGYEALTVEGIAARAGVGKQTIYRWWPSKGAVVADAFLDDGSYFPSATPTGDGIDWVRDLARYSASEVGTSIIRAMTSAAAEDAVIAARLNDQFTQPVLDGIVVWLADVAPNDSDELRRAGADMLLGAVVFRVLTQAEPLSEARAELVLRLVVEGLRSGSLFRS